MVSAKLRPIYPPERPGTRCIGGWVGPRTGLDGCGNYRPPQGFDPQTVQPVASRYCCYLIRSETEHVHVTLNLSHSAVRYVAACGKWGSQTGFWSCKQACGWRPLSGNEVINIGMSVASCFLQPVSKQFLSIVYPTLVPITLPHSTWTRDSEKRETEVWNTLNEGKQRTTQEGITMVLNSSVRGLDWFRVGPSGVFFFPAQ